MPIDRRAQDKINSRNKYLNDKKDSQENSQKEPQENSSNTIESSLNTASKMWDDLKKRVNENPSFVELPDHEKVRIYQDTEYKNFYTEHPIVCRYMVCMGQFSGKAFKRYLLKCKSMSAQKHVIDKTVENPSEDRWIQRQADYVRYLWESYQRHHFNPNDAQDIWQNAYNTLSKECKDFKDMHKNIEEKMKIENKSNKAELVKEMLTRISSEEQTLDEHTTNRLIEKLKSQVIEQRRKKLIDQINSDVELIPPTRISQGCKKILKPSTK